MKKGIPWTWEQLLESLKEEKMAFGENYSPVYTAPTLADGEYKARIKSAELAAYSNGNEYCKVAVEVQGHPGELPNMIILNEAPKLGTFKASGAPIEQKDVDRANRQLTTFFECFGIQDGDFNFLHWKGKIGTIKVAPQYDGNEPDKKSKSFKQIFPQKPKAEQGNTLPPAPEATPAGAPATKSEGFPEDIPFF